MTSSLGNNRRDTANETNRPTNSNIHKLLLMVEVADEANSC